jgi:peptide/nickel transport system substrate-binding protein
MRGRPIDMYLTHNAVRFQSAVGHRRLLRRQPQRGLSWQKTELPHILRSFQPLRRWCHKQNKRLEMTLVEHAIYYPQIRKDVNAIVFYRSAHFSVADSYPHEFYRSRSKVGTSTQVTNLSHCSVADKEIDAARATPNATTRNALWRSAQARINADICAIPLFDLQQVWVRRRALEYGVPFEGALTLIPSITKKTTLTR